MENAAWTSYYWNFQIVLQLLHCFLLLQPFADKKPSGAYDVWSVDIFGADITQRVSEVVVIVVCGSGQLEVTSVVAKGCIETGNTSSLSASPVVTHMIG